MADQQNGCWDQHVNPLSRVVSGNQDFGCAGAFRCSRCYSVHVICAKYQAIEKKDESTPEQVGPTDIVASEPSKPRNDDATDSDTDDESDAATDMNTKGNSLDGLNEDDYEINFEINGVLPSLDIVYESAREKVKQTQLPLTVGPMTFLSFGNLPEDNDLLDTYHSEHYLYPIGFKSLREYWDVENPFEKCVYANEIKDGGESGLFLLYRNRQS